MKTFKLFLSYKEFDGDAVVKVKELLEGFADKHLKIKTPDFQVFLARASIRVSEDWRSQIYQRLLEADSFVLFHTTPNADWDWCMYEGGVYEAASYAKGGKPSLIAILSTSNQEPPEPLGSLQVCYAEQEQIYDCLVKPIIDKIGLEEPGPDQDIDGSLLTDIEALCDAIVSVFAPYRQLDELRFLKKGRAFLPTIKIRCRLRQVFEGASFFKDADVTLEGTADGILGSADKLSLEAFWKLNIVKDAWIETIKESLVKAVQTPELIPPWKIVIASTKGEGFYRPVLTYAYTEGEHIYFEIRLIELLDDTDKYTPNLNRLLRLLKLCHSYRAQLVEALQDMNPQWAPKGFFEVQRALENLRVLTDHLELQSGPNPLKNHPEDKELEAAAKYFKRLETGLDLCVRCADHRVPADGLLETIGAGMHSVNGLWLSVVALAYSNEVTQYRPTGPIYWAQLDESLQLQLKTYEKKLAGASSASNEGEHAIVGRT